MHGDIVADPFAETRTKHGIKIIFPPALVENSARLLAQSPKGWETLSFTKDAAQLQKIVSEFPNFGPGIFYLSKELKSVGDTRLADDVYKKYIEVRSREVL